MSDQPSQETFELWYISEGRREVLQKIRAVYRRCLELRNRIDLIEARHTDQDGAKVREFVSGLMPEFHMAVVDARLAVDDEVETWKRMNVPGSCAIVDHYAIIRERLEDPKFAFEVIPDGPDWRTRIKPKDWAAFRISVDLYDLRVPSPGPQKDANNQYEF